MAQMNIEHQKEIIRQNRSRDERAAGRAVTQARERQNPGFYKKGSQMVMKPEGDYPFWDMVTQTWRWIAVKRTGEAIVVWECERCWLEDLESWKDGKEWALFGNFSSRFVVSFLVFLLVLNIDPACLTTKAFQRYPNRSIEYERFEQPGNW
jgi:hypothetical protein